MKYKYAVGYNGEVLTRPMSLEEAASLAAAMNADDSLEYGCIEFLYEVIAIQEIRPCF